MKPNASPTERFDGWFAKSIAKLKELPEGDGAFAALMIAFPWYERCIRAKLKLQGKATQDEDLQNEIAIDLGLTNHQRSVFWDAFRNGFMHGAMPKSGKTLWAVSHEFTEMPTFKTVAGVTYICLDPWKFADRVIHLFNEDPRLITASDSFPLANVFFANLSLFH